MREIHQARMVHDGDSFDWGMIRCRKLECWTLLFRDFLPSQMGDLLIRAAAQNLSRRGVVNPLVLAGLIVLPQLLAPTHHHRMQDRVPQ